MFFIYIFVMQIIIQMKSLSTLLTALLLQMSVMAAGHGKGASEIYELIEAKCSSTFSMSVNQDFEDLFNMDLDMNGNEKMVKGDFKRGRFLVVDKKEYDYQEILKEFKKRGYYERKIEDDDDNSDNDQLYVMVDQKGNDLKEVHFAVESDEKIILLSIYGDIHLEKK